MECSIADGYSLAQYPPGIAAAARTPTAPPPLWGGAGQGVLSPIPIHCCFLLKHGMLGRNLRIELQGEATLNCDVGQGQRPAATSTTRWAPGQWALAPPHHTQAARPEYVERKKISARSFVFKD